MDRDDIMQRVDELLARPDCYLTRERIEGFLDAGDWSEESFVHDLERHASERPDALAMIDEDGRRTTYGEYEQRTRELALALIDLGLQRGDRVAMQLPNVSEFCITLMACARAGLVPVFLHIVYQKHDLAYILNLTGARVLVAMREFRGRDHLGLALEMRDEVDSVEHVISVGGGEGTFDFEEMIAAQASSDDAVLQERRPTGVDPFFIMFTSGTTGRPKAELHLHANNQYWIQAFEELQNFPQDAHWLLVTPIAHLTGLGIGVLSALKRGAAFTLLTAWDADTCVELLERNRPSYVLGAPPMLIDLARNPGLDQRDVSSVEKICYAGAPCPAEILHTLNDKLGCEIIAFYGYTEGGATHGTRPGDPIAVTSRSIGAIAPGMEMRLVDDDGEDPPLPGEGELWVRGPNFIAGYFGQPEVTERMFTDDGWFRSADVVRFDENGYGYFISRKDDLINRGGYKIDPREIEELLYEHPQVGQAAVVAMPDERLGQRPAAFIVAKEPGQDLDLDDVTGFLDEKGLSRTKWPEAVEMVEEFPMTSTGKFMRYDLRERAQQLRPQR
ncbi:MAG: acyl--CoA ligase [Actinobacteria bacterium]|nr:acyl--CoA ligase [Actinomycetota bacterium]